MGTTTNGKACTCTAESDTGPDSGTRESGPPTNIEPETGPESGPRDARAPWQAPVDDAPRVYTVGEIDTLHASGKIPPGARVEVWGAELAIVASDGSEVARLGIDDVGAFLSARWSLGFRA